MKDKELNRKSDKYRKSIYESFAKAARQLKLEWVVLHGDEGYPTTIGRDLDIMCRNQEEIKHAIEIFNEVASSNKNTKWIITPNPLWGKRVLAISSDYEVAELHILNRLCTGIINYDINFKNIDYNQLFPKDNEARFFKSIIMPLLGNNRKVIKNINDDMYIQPPKTINKYINKIDKYGKINMLDKISIYFTYNKSFKNMFDNLTYTLKIKKNIYISQTTPILKIHNNKFDNNTFFEYLSEVFLDFICGDNLTSKEIKYHQARQRLVYFNINRKDISVDLTLENLDLDEALVKTLDSFKKYNDK